MDFHETHIRLFFENGPQEKKIELLYDEWIEMLNAIKSINPSLKNWYFITKSTSSKVEYADVFNDQKSVISYSRNNTKKYNRRYGGAGLITFQAWSQQVPVKGQSDEDSEFFAKVFYSSGTPVMKSLIHFTIQRLQDISPENYWEIFVQIVRQLVKIRKPIWLDIFPEDYPDHAVFPHRQWVGWMAVVPDVDLTGEFPFVAHDEYIPDVGTLLVATREYCDDLNPSHVELGQAIEIALADRGLLPKRN